MSRHASFHASPSRSEQDVVTSQIVCLTEWCVAVWGYPQMAARLLACIVDGKAYTPGSYHGSLTTDDESITIHRLVPGRTWLRARSQRWSMRHARMYGGVCPGSSLRKSCNLYDA
jgi:hypothetical protein